MQGGKRTAADEHSVETKYTSGGGLPGPPGPLPLNDVVVTPFNDYSGSTSKVIPQYPWATPDDFISPSVPAPDHLNAVRFSPNGEFLVVGFVGGLPHVAIYQRTNDTFAPLTSSTLSSAGNVNGICWSADSQFLAIANSATPFIIIYQRSGDTFTKLADPAVLPPYHAKGVAFSANGQFLAVAHYWSPFITIYQRSGSTFTKLANPAVLPSGTGLAVSFSLDEIGRAHV